MPDTLTFTSVVVAVGNALCLVLSSRCVHGYHGTLAEARGVVMVNHSRAAEDRYFWFNKADIKKNLAIS